MDFFFLRFLQEFHVGSVIFPHAFVLDRGDWSCSDAHLHLTHTYPTYYPSLLYPSILYLTLPYHLALPFTTSFIRYSVFLFDRIAHLHSEALCEHYSPKSSPLVRFFAFGRRFAFKLIIATKFFVLRAGGGRKGVMPPPTCEYIILVQLDFLFWYGRPFEMVGVEERGKT